MKQMISYKAGNLLAPTPLSCALLVFFSLFLAVCVSSKASAVQHDPLAEADRLASLEFVLQDAISRKLISGAVLLIGNSSGVLFEHAAGKSGFEEGDPLLSVDTIFDVASLTKVVATTAAIVGLVEQGHVSLLEPASKWFPELAGHDITVLDLLTHRSGLHDKQLDLIDPLGSAVRNAAQLAGRIPVREQFKYADINFILLGEIVHRESGQPLDVYCLQKIFRPLGMHRTGFNPSAGLRVAATLGGNGSIVGVVQDYNARKLGGVAGHAGLFSTAHDLARFARMLLSGGTLDGFRVFSQESVTQMTASYFSNNGSVVRGLGWDRDSSYSAPRGRLFSDSSYGHTGYSGASIWIDPKTDLYVILLSTRMNYSNRRHFNRLRSDVATIGAALFGGNLIAQTSQKPENTQP